MKKILIVFLLLSFRTTFGQVMWLPVTINFNIPLSVNSHSWGIDPNGGKPYDNYGGGEEKIQEQALGKLQNYSRSGDTIVLSYYIMDYYFENIGISFIFDSIGKQLKHFSFTTRGSAARVTRNFSVQFKSISFIQTSDTTFFINDSGIECINDIEKVSYFYDYTSNPGPSGSNRKISNSDSLFKNDTSSFRITFSFQSLRLSGAVDERLLPRSTLILVYLPSGTIKINHSPIDHTQSLLIYDILGREVKRIEIPSGVSEYSLPHGEFPSGCYFARLGNLGAKFVVF